MDLDEEIPDLGQSSLDQKLLIFRAQFHQILNCEVLSFLLLIESNQASHQELLQSIASCSIVRIAQESQMNVSECHPLTHLDFLLSNEPFS